MRLRKRLQTFYDLGREAGFSGVPPNTGAFFDKDSRWLEMAYLAGYQSVVRRALPSTCLRAVNTASGPRPRTTSQEHTYLVRYETIATRRARLRCVRRSAPR